MGLDSLPREEQWKIGLNPLGIETAEDTPIAFGGEKAREVVAPRERHGGIASD